MMISMQHLLLGPLYCAAGPAKTKTTILTKSPTTTTTVLLLLLLPVYVILTLSPCSYSYNLDEHNAILKQGPKGSYFGYSVAQHATYDPQAPNETYKSYIIVGAPRDSSRSAGLTGAQRPGAIYKCQFNQLKTCQQLELDSPLSSSSSQSTTATTGPVAQRDDQWLGVSVKSQGENGFAVACAHKFVMRGPQYRWPQGICYSLTSNLTYHRTWQPCLNRPVNKAHEEYGSCQAGTSSDISDTSDIVLGSPGPYTWRGSVFSNSITFTAKDDRTWYMAPVQDDEAKVYKYSYLGMSIITGRFFRGKTQFISGAPRSKESGQVLVMSKQSGDSNLRTDQILDGEQMGSSFGYTLAKMDFNGDGHLDLVVAAPFYYNKTEGGAVYLYANDNNKQLFVPAGRLTGKPESRFGFALANCGDLNHDHYDDLAIGAPYDPAGGAVYIYLGSAQGLRPNPSQIIRASAVASSMQTFGYSLSGGLDLDQNGYPDLAIGSYSDDQVLILRARPIVKISTKIEGDLNRIDPNKTSCDDGRNQVPCFKFNACFELDAANLGAVQPADSLKLKYRIEADTSQKYPRVAFQESENSETPNVVEREIVIGNQNRGIKRCNTQRVYIKNRSAQTPIQFSMTYSLVPPPASKQHSASLMSLKDTSIPAPFPILNQEEAQRVFSARFLRDCGANDICESYLEVNGSLQMPRETLGVNEAGYATDKQVNVTIKVDNKNEPAYEARLFVTHPANLAYSGFKPLKQHPLIECASLEKTLVRCELGSPMMKGSMKMMMMFNTQNQAGTFNFNLMVNTTSQNTKEARTSADLSGTIRRKIEPQLLPKPPVYPEPPTQDPPAWLILASILLGILLFSALFYCLWVNGFFERSKAQYTAANTEDITN
uniref:Integrin alpha-PS1 n=1 Tax=Aceria tosichella TaxID=561515 RepID=A0A6G1S610_9ACAR